MKAKGVIRKDLEWRESRRFFYWRLRRRLNEQTMIRAIQNVAGKHAISQSGAINRLKAWYFEYGKTNWDDGDRDVATWLEGDGKAINAKIEWIKNDRITKELLKRLDVPIQKKREGISFETYTRSELDRK